MSLGGLIVLELNAKNHNKNYLLIILLKMQGFRKLRIKLNQ